MSFKDRSVDKKVVTHRIAVGRPGESERSAPSALDHFEITLNERPRGFGLFPVDHEAHKRLADFGVADTTKPRRVPIRVDADDIDAFLLQEYQSRRKLTVLDRMGQVLVNNKGEEVTRPTLWCHGDGVSAQRMTRDRSFNTVPCRSSPKYRPWPEGELAQLLKGKAVSEMASDDHRCPFSQNSDNRAGPTCKPTTVLICRCDVVGGLGTFARFRSHGHQTADAMRSSLEQIKSRMPNGILRDVPLMLVLRMVPTPNPTGGMKPQPVVHVELRLPYDATIRLLDENLKLQMSIAGALLAREHLLLKAHAEKDDEVDGEFEPVLAGAEGGGGLGR